MRNPITAPSGAQQQSAKKITASERRSADRSAATRRIRGGGIDLCATPGPMSKKVREEQEHALKHHSGIAEERKNHFRNRLGELFFTHRVTRTGYGILLAVSEFSSVGAPCYTSNRRVLYLGDLHFAATSKEMPCVSNTLVLETAEDSKGEAVSAFADNGNPVDVPSVAYAGIGPSSAANCPQARDRATVAVSGPLAANTDNGNIPPRKGSSAASGVAKSNKAQSPAKAAFSTPPKTSAKRDDLTPPDARLNVANTNTRRCSVDGGRHASDDRTPTPPKSPTGVGSVDAIFQPNRSAKDERPRCQTTEFDVRMANTIDAFCIKNKWLRSRDKRKGPEAVAILRRDLAAMGIGEEQIERGWNTYVADFAAHGRLSWLQLRNAAELRQQWNRIAKLIVDTDRTRPLDPAELNDDERMAYNDATRRIWVQGAETHLPRAIRDSRINLEQFITALSIANLEPSLADIRTKILGELSVMDHYLTGWFRDVWFRTHRRTNWDGNLASYVWVPNDPRFVASVMDSLDKYFGYADRAGYARILEITQSREAESCK